MKRSITYIIIFFSICYILGDVSKLLTDKIYFSHAPKLIQELTVRLSDEGEVLYLDGGIVKAFIIATGGNDIRIDGEKVRWREISEQFNFRKDKYKVYINNGILDITRLGNKDNTSISTLKSVDVIIKWKNIVANLLTISIGILIYSIYDITDKKKITAKKHKMKVVEHLN